MHVMTDAGPHFDQQYIVFCSAMSCYDSRQACLDMIRYHTIIIQHVGSIDASKIAGASNRNLHCLMKRVPCLCNVHCHHSFALRLN